MRGSLVGMGQQLVGKICLVTGASSGIGRETAQGLAAAGGHVVLLCRNEAKGRQAQAEIKQITQNPQIDLLLADLSNKKEVYRVAQEFKQKYSQLHLLVNNAGGYFATRQETADGFEHTLALNHLAYFSLTTQLLEVMQSTPSGRIINVSSIMHYLGHIYFEDIQLKKSFGGIKAYCQSKLANVLFTYELARRLDKTNITVNCLHPGVVSSGFAKNNGWWAIFLANLGRPFTISVQKGAANSIYLATAPELARITGKYFHGFKPFSSKPISYNQQVASRLWEISEELTQV